MQGKRSSLRLAGQGYSFSRLQFLNVPIPDVPFPSGNQQEEVNAFLEEKIRTVSFHIPKKNTKMLVVSFSLFKRASSAGLKSLQVSRRPSLLEFPRPSASRSFFSS